MADTSHRIGDASFFDELSRLASSIAPMRRAPTMHDIWLRASVNAFDPDDAFEIIKPDNPSASSASFFRRRRMRLTSRLHLLGIEDGGLLTDVFYQDQTSAQALAEAVVKRGLPVWFGHFPGESLFVDTLKKAARGKGYVLSNSLPGLSYIRLDETWKDAEQKFSSSRRTEIRRRWKKARELGDVAVEVLKPAPREVDALLDEAITVEASGWKTRSGTAIAQNKNLQSFFRQYARLASEAGIFRLCFLRIDGKAVAVTIAAECHDAFWQFKIGYDETYKKCSPGTLLQIETVRHAAKEGFSIYEFLGHAPWMKEWTTDEHPLNRLGYYPYNIAGAEAFFTDAVETVAKRVKSKIRPQ